VSLLRIILKIVKNDLVFDYLPERDIEGPSKKVPCMAAGLPAGSALLAHPFSDMGILMTAQGKQQPPDSGESETEGHRQIRNRMDRMGLDPDQRRFIEEMLDDEEGGAPSE
jgi:hypothetical protein